MIIIPNRRRMISNASSEFAFIVILQDSYWPEQADIKGDGVGDVGGCFINEGPKEDEFREAILLPISIVIRLGLISSQ